MKQFSQESQRELVEQLDRLVADKVRSQDSIRTSRISRLETADAQLVQATRDLEADTETAKQQLSQELTRALADITRDYERAVAERVRRFEADAQAQQAETAAVVQQATRACRGARTGAEQDYDRGLKEATDTLAEAQATIGKSRENLTAVRSEVERVLRKRRCRKPASQLPPPEPEVSNQPLDFFHQQLAAARQATDAFAGQWAARFLGSGWLFVIFVFTWIAFVAIGILLGMLEWPWAIAGGAVGFGVAAIVYVVVRPIAVRQTLQVYEQFLQHEANGLKALAGVKAWAVAEADRQRILLRQARDRKITDAEQELERIRNDRKAEVRNWMQAEETVVKEEKQRLAEQRTERQRDANRSFDTEFETLERRHEEQLVALRQKHQQQRENSEAAYARSLERLQARWSEGLQVFREKLAFVSGYSQRHFPSWSGDWDLPPSQENAVAKFGELNLRAPSLESLEFDGDSEQELIDYSIPALHAFNDRPAMLWEAWGDGREAASRSMRNVMLRLLTSLPAGKTRFTIIDPLGLGQNFSAFMHLADIDEKLISHRIWTEPNHIQQRLADLTEHMEDVIQTYLRNEYASIDDYNRQAGEVSEPFRILVIANFPAGFTDESAARLQSILSSGARCGVYTLISTDSRLELPRDFDLSDLEAKSLTLQWTDEEFCWLEPVLREVPLQLEEPPEDLEFTRIVREAGERARDANRVEVPFETVAPSEDQRWQSDSRQEIAVPLGRAGANKLQSLRLGRGTSQHVLISGKTGSGKSTLLHALIMNTALHYSPRDVQFYLVDFKKGVEFKPYAEHGLPHARVIAIESEREFGLSVLRKLDDELKQRGDLFRSAGVQDLAAYREAEPAKPMPRLLLVIDEFQELFVQDDRLAQDANLLLDRLVRQGRAFGIHVLLGSQTLAGAYSLARSTIGQMAIRIALQCSEADSHLILSEDNTAARLLDRPGDAIYNDENGRFEGNHPFQVVWLGAREQHRYLQQLAEVAAKEDGAAPPPVVFEGNVPADPAENRELAAVLEGSVAEPAQLTAWLGAAVAIKPPTRVTFARQSGCNLLVVGQQPAAALGIFVNAIVSIAASAAGPKKLRPKIIVFNGQREPVESELSWADLHKSLPGNVSLVAPRKLEAEMKQLHAELQRRMAAEEGAAHPAIFCCVYNLSGIRDLRRAENEFGFGSLDRDAEPSLSQCFVELLREGPVHGIHCWIWCDTYNSLNRWLDRQVLRELDLRVLFQMSASDSSNLMDSPLASRLGPNRALLFSEESGDHEKFRPYMAPAKKWLDHVNNQLRRPAKRKSLA